MPALEVYSGPAKLLEPIRRPMLSHGLYVGRSAGPRQHRRAIQVGEHQRSPPSLQRRSQLEYDNSLEETAKAQDLKSTSTVHLLLVLYPRV